MTPKTMSIKSCVFKIKRTQLFLPAIQRKMVWDREKIINYFDSILRGYPIGTFIFWNLNKKIVNSYPFYKFLSNFNEKHENNNELLQRNLWKGNENSFGILDGQQRLSSLYLGLTGEYVYRKKGKSRKFEEKNFVKSKLYINLFENKDYFEKSNNMFEFKFLSEDESKKIDASHLWFEVGKILNEDFANVKIHLHKFIEFLESENKNKNIIAKFNNDKIRISKLFNLLFKKINEEKILSYTEVHENNLEKIVNIFQRVNSGGLVLTKADLLFSRLVSNWPEGRSKVDAAITELKESGVNVDVDFIVRTCLTLSDLPVIYRESEFKDDSKIRIIENNWELIIESLRKTAFLLKNFGFNKKNLRSKNSVIPLAYYISKGGDIKDKKVKKDLRKYLIVSHIKNIFSGQGDNVLAKIRDGLIDKNSKNLIQKKFTFNQLYKIKFSGGKDYKINRKFINEKLMEKELGPEAFMLLALLYKNIDFAKNKFEMDHIHPKSEFTNRKLKKFIKSSSKIKKWNKLKNKISNLQLLIGEVNQEKLKTSLPKWLEKIENDETGSKSRFISENFIPNLKSFDLNNFDNFYLRRKRILANELKKELLS